MMQYNALDQFGNLQVLTGAFRNDDLGVRYIKYASFGVSLDNLLESTGANVMLRQKWNYSKKALAFVSSEDEAIKRALGFEQCTYVKHPALGDAFYEGRNLQPGMKEVPFRLSPLQSWISSDGLLVIDNVDVVHGPHVESLLPMMADGEVVLDQGRPLRLDPRNGARLGVVRMYPRMHKQATFVVAYTAKPPRVHAIALEWPSMTEDLRNTRTKMQRTRSELK